LNFVPIPTAHAHLRAWAPHWLPLLAGISRRSKESIEQLIDRVISGHTQIALVWDGERAHALIGMQYVKRADDLIGEVVWLTGSGMKEWTHLLPQMESYLREHMQCKAIRPICRPGWSRLILDEQGYKVTHLVMEKIL